ncbi:MAG TPA: DUF192 domain-containing protein [Bryobacteraceae bacterium]|nr:DUF192 domain-containing protein [Bryobacteraceae bacterium]
MRYLLLCAALALAWTGCGSSGSDANTDVLQTRTISLPNGGRIRAEVKIQAIDMQRGMMFRESLPAGQGMLFIHRKPGPYTYWMYNVLIPLDIVWMDSNHRILEISHNTPPCKTKASECPNYGGKPQSQYVLEIGAGEAARHGLKVGDTLSF